jgi:predicted metal-dependent RNase
MLNQTRTLNSGLLLNVYTTIDYISIRATSYGLSKLQKRNISKQFGHTILLDKEEKRDIVRFFKEEVPLE